MKQITNPFLKNYEYIPDGEPHVFSGRVYLYGSHDAFGQFPFCHNPYVTYSADINDLTSWKYEGIIYPKKNRDPLSKNGKKDYYAPDVCLGPDGKYYRVYSYAWSSIISVCVSSSPKGPFEFLGHIHYKNGELLGRRKKDPFAFDPAIFVDDDKRIYLYSGFGARTFFPQIPFGHKPEGSFVRELENDRLTIKSEPKKVIIEDPKGLMGLKHSFFEASSRRKFFNRYYFIYSSQEGHELCYGTSLSPFGPFTYQGVLISNGDVGLNGRKRKDALYPLGNNHGSLEEICGRYYIFYHRHTNYTNTDRQALAEAIVPDGNGFFPQAERTSQGLNGKPLIGKGVYNSSICSLLIPKEGNVFYPFFRPIFFSKTKTYITQKEKDNRSKESQYIHNVKDSTLVGYKYFDLKDSRKVALSLEGKFKGTVSLRYQEKGETIASASISLKGSGKAVLDIQDGQEKTALYFFFQGKGKCDFLSLSFE